MSQKIPEKERSETELAELLREVRRIDVQSRRLVSGTLAGGYSSVFRGAGIEFEEVREFTEDDDPRAIDWNVTARMGRLFVKKFVDERELVLILALDLTRSMAGGFGAWSARETATRIAACLALSAVKHNDRIGFVAFTDRIEEDLPPRKGRAQALRIVRDTLALPFGGGTTGVKTAIEHLAKTRKRRAVIFLLSDFLETGYDHSLRVLASRHDVVAVRLLLPELSPQPRGLLRIVDPESGAVRLADFRHGPQRSALTSKAEAEAKRQLTMFQRAGVDLIDVPIPPIKSLDAIARPLLRFFRMREERGARA